MTNTYYVTVRVTGAYITEVNARDVSEAKALAMNNWTDADFGELSDIDGCVSVVENIEGDRVYER